MILRCPAIQPSSEDAKDQGLLLTRRKVPDRVQHVEMPQCLAVCELEDGRLALLFADSHVRHLELVGSVLQISRNGSPLRNLGGS